MPIANYTTEVSPENSASEITRMLVAHNAHNVSFDYANQKLVGLTFIVPTKYGEVQYALPANIKAAKTVMERQHVRAFVDETRAARVAWRNLRDWIRAQLAMVEMEMVTLDQVMLPYALVTDAAGKTQTFYQLVETHGPQLLGQGKGPNG